MNKYVTTIPVEYMQERPDYYLFDGTGWLYSPPAGQQARSKVAAMKQAAKLAGIRKMDYEVLTVKMLVKGRTVFLPVRSDHKEKWVQYLDTLGNFELISD